MSRSTNHELRLPGFRPAPAQGVAVGGLDESQPPCAQLPAVEHFDINTIAGLRDRALVGVMVYSLARVGAVVGMNVEDYFQEGKRWWFRLREKGGTPAPANAGGGAGERHEVPAHHNAEAYADAYVAAAPISADRKGPLFRSLDRERHLTERRLPEWKCWQ